MRFSTICLLLVALWAVSPAYAIIIVGGGNSVNLTDPGNGSPWNEVARITNSTGTHVSSGSAVHLGGGYMLTANHVNLSQGYVSFDGSSMYQIAVGSAVQVTSGMDVIDLKVFKLTSNPGTAGVNLLPENVKGVELFTPYNQALQIGWGIGHSPTDTDNPWTWGSAEETSKKRWGVNNIEGSILDFGYQNTNYDFEAIYTALDSDATLNEAAATLFDSGSGLFIQDDLDNWYMAGTIVAVSTNGSSTFASDESQDLNFAVRISEYANEIQSLLTDPIAVPEASAFYAFLAAGLIFLSRRSGVQSRTRGCRRSL